MQSHQLLLRHDLYQGLVQECSDTRVAARAEPHSLLPGVSVIKIAGEAALVEVLRPLQVWAIKRQPLRSFDLLYLNPKP
jgi:hypothetical protein